MNIIKSILNGIWLLIRKIFLGFGEAFRLQSQKAFQEEIPEEIAWHCKHLIDKAFEQTNVKLTGPVKQILDSTVQTHVKKHVKRLTSHIYDKISNVVDKI